VSVENPYVNAGYISWSHRSGL